MWQKFINNLNKEVVQKKGDIEIPAWKWHILHLFTTIAIVFVLQKCGINELTSVIVATIYYVWEKLRQGGYAIFKGEFKLRYKDVIADWDNYSFIWAFYFIDKNLDLGISLFIGLIIIYFIAVSKGWANP